MRLIIGLGNPGEKYALTRHNLGFMFLDHLRKIWNFPEFENNKKFQALVSKGQDFILAKPETFMNLSGESVRSLLDFYKLEPSDIIVIHDDLDIETGKYKMATNSSSAGHNGVEDIIEKLGTKEFKRVRIGIGQSAEEKLECPLDMHSFVLGKLTNKEKDEIEKLFPEIEKEIR
ncbi:MAG: aminoacyl-tRNA hydrolase [Patescibacteria group bacterium]